MGIANSRGVAAASLVVLGVLLLVFGADTACARGGLADPQEVRVGTYVVDVYDIDIAASRITIDFYLWFNYQKQPDRPINPAETIRLVNATEVTMSPPVTRTEGQNVYQLVRCKAVIKKTWTVADYPFDEHTIRFYIEDGGGAGSDIRYVADRDTSKLDPRLRIPGWDLSPLKIERQDREWATVFGDPLLQGQGSLSTSRILVSFKIERPAGGFSLFFKVFAGVIVSVLIAFLALMLPPELEEVRAGLTVGALFAAVGSQLATSTFLPPSSIPTLVDTLHNLSFFFVGATAFVAVVTKVLHHGGREKQAEGINRRAVRFLLPAWILLVIVVALYYFNAELSTPPYY